MIAIALGLLMSIGCRTSGPTSSSSASTSPAASIPRYTSGVVQAPTAQDSETTILMTSDDWATVVAFFDQRMQGWKRMEIPAQHFQQIPGGGIVVPTANTNGNRGLIRWTELKTSRSVTVTDRDGKIEIMEYVPARTQAPARRSATDAERDSDRR